ncbi:hypothetical protein KCP69_04410 [Salmonella enterica subsp. enterica]|nr:hypothetical protein KCP69_04410 [Salmonella enterica subsp. enterica]
MGGCAKMTADVLRPCFQKNAMKSLSEFNALIMPRDASTGYPCRMLILKSFYYDDSAGFTLFN